jgi:predicted DNA-binding antitoxin AbrB/MazE fold protein
VISILQVAVLDFLPKNIQHIQKHSVGLVEMTTLEGEQVKVILRFQEKVILFYKRFEGMPKKGIHSTLGFNEKFHENRYSTKSYSPNKFKRHT